MNAHVESNTQPQAVPGTPPVDTGPVKTKFFFKSRKEKSKDPVTGAEVVTVIPAIKAVELVVPYLGVSDVIAITNSGDDKQLALLLEAVNKFVEDQARSLVEEDVEKAREQGIDNEQLSWEFISKIPPATRRGGGIADEIWEAFMLDYTNVMQHHGKTKEKAETGAKLLSKRFLPVKDQKKVVKALQENLMTWFTNSEQQEEFQKIYEMLTSKADSLLARDEDLVMQSI